MIRRENSAAHRVETVEHGGHNRWAQATEKKGSPIHPQGVRDTWRTVSEDLEGGPVVARKEYPSEKPCLNKRWLGGDCSHPPTVGGEGK